MPPHAPSIDHLLKLNPAIPEPADFDAFWAGTLAASRKHDLNATFEPVKDDAFQLFNAYDLTFSGYDGQRIRGWVVEPAAARNAGKKLPCVVTYMGYGGGRSLPTDHLLFTTVGAVNLIMDNRGQGAQGTPGATGDIGTTGPQFSGMMTRGIDSRDTYFYRRLFTDAARAIEAAKAFDLVDPKRIVLFGANQGGAAALAAAALAPDDVHAIMIDAPSHCDLPSAVMRGDGMHGEVLAYLKAHRTKGEAVFNTLAYFDALHFAARTKAKALFSVAMLAAPNTTFAAFNRLKGEKQIKVYPFNGAEGGGIDHALEQMRFVREMLF